LGGSELVTLFKETGEGSRGHRKVLIGFFLGRFEIEDKKEEQKQRIVQAWAAKFPNPPLSN
jgi:hypothetical protein